MVCPRDSTRVSRQREGPLAKGVRGNVSPPTSASFYKSEVISEKNSKLIQDEARRDAEAALHMRRARPTGHSRQRPQAQNGGKRPRVPGPPPHRKADTEAVSRDCQTPVLGRRPRGRAPSAPPGCPAHQRSARPRDTGRAPLHPARRLLQPQTHGSPREALRDAQDAPQPP